MNDTIQMPPLTEEDMRTFLDSLEEAVIPCTSKGLTSVETIRTTPECGKPAVWLHMKPCGHVGYHCEKHYQDSHGDLAFLGFRCTICGGAFDTEDVKWSRL